MNLQYIHDSKGNTTGVFIPIEEWQSIKEKYNGLQEDEMQDFEIPDWHKKILDERLEDYYKNPQNAKNFDELLQSKREKYGL
ncbi:addiction module protein [Epilithonimonas hominis]|uniref:Addiction module component CHP02574 family protein n=1 Tax=Epilithonimonas hominis TaxID=420404 RepID=A0A3N0X1D1_9FLAO|nr:addiction module protein [Epilithonimonas hominis]ROI11152.1 addiction module component CHP02574 family protein [Epilithonimonas hominis]